jgi:WhiB family transcriptional regulator, redox-sensing transcriptional regulator
MGRLSLPAAIMPVPDLKGAACEGRSDLFDLAPFYSGDRAQREARALAICARCPVLGACSAWFASLPAAERPYGVIAGRVHRPRGPRAPAAGRSTLTTTSARNARS